MQQQKYYLLTFSERILLVFLNIKYQKYHAYVMQAFRQLSDFRCLTDKPASMKSNLPKETNTDEADLDWDHNK